MEPQEETAAAPGPASPGPASPVRAGEGPGANARFAALMAGRRFEDVRLAGAAQLSRGRGRGRAPVGPITRLIRPRPLGRALDLGD